MKTVGGVEMVSPPDRRGQGCLVEELDDWLELSIARCQAERAYGPAFRLDVARDITRDVARNEREAGDEAEGAAADDLRAVEILKEAAADGLTNADRPALAEAIRCIRRSAKRDRRIAHALP